jgi:hypothetical protein
VMIPVVFGHDSTEYLKSANHYESVGRKAADLSPYRNKVEGLQSGSISRVLVSDGGRGKIEVQP